MHRRNFLTAISGCLGALCFWRPEKRIGPPRPRPQPKPRNPRWQWEIGEWKTHFNDGSWICRHRIWMAKVTLLSDELHGIVKGMHHVNIRRFCGAETGTVMVKGMRCDPIGHNLMQCEITLTECRDDHDGYCFYSMTDLYGLFRGEHAIVSVGGKEV